MLFDLMVLLGKRFFQLLEERNLTMINQNQESEATLEETRNKLKNEINKRQAEVDKYRENMDFLDNQSKARSVVDASTIFTYKAPGAHDHKKDYRDKHGKINSNP